MSRSRIRLLVLLAIGLIIVGVPVIVFVDLNYSNIGPDVAGVYTTAGLIAILSVLVGIILYIVAWFGALIKTARIQQMGWFTLILLLGIIPLFIYALVGPETPNAPAVVYVPSPSYPPQAGYPAQPGYSPPPNYPPSQPQ